MPPAYREYLRVLRGATSPAQFFANLALPLDTLMLYACLDGARSEAEQITSDEKQKRDDAIRAQNAQVAAMKQTLR